MDIFNILAIVLAIAAITLFLLSIIGFARKEEAELSKDVTKTIWFKAGIVCAVIAVICFII
jgi:cytochrome c oxidase assembly factor CtaG